MREKINQDMIAAMKSGNKELLAVIRMVKSQIQLEEINSKKELTDDEVINVISKQIKMRKDSIVEFAKGDRQDLIDKNLSEIDILVKYLPEQLTSEQINKLIDETISTTNATSVADLGKIMKELTPKVKGKADMSIITNLIKEKLN